MNVTVILADGCEEVEALTIIDVLRRAQVNVKGVSVSNSLTVKGSHGIDFNADAFFDENEQCDMIVLPGGMGGRNNILASVSVLDKCKKMADEDKYVCAICAAPTILGRSGILNGKKATCYPGLENELNGAVIQEGDVVVDGKIITSKGPATAMKFAVELVRAIKGDDVANSVASGLLLREPLTN